MTGFARRVWPRRNDLMRRADWLEAALLLAAIISAVLLLPVACAVGSVTYANQTQAGLEQSQVRHPVTATLLHDAPTTSRVPARWAAPDGSEHFGTVRASTGAKTGNRVTVWLDGKGNPVDEPVTHEQAAMAGLAIGMGVWISSAAGLCVLYLLGRIVLNRRRSAAWQRDWARVAPEWTRRG